jgi:RNA polymerase sigma-70 factor (ECF subfamily)
MATTATGIRATRDLDELYRAHAAEVYRYAYAVLGNTADAEDVTQTTFVNALSALERGEQPRQPTNWLITIAHNLIRQRFRQQRSRPREVELDRDVPTLAADDEGPSLDDLVLALQRIPAAQREALVLRELEGRPYKEIAPILGVSLTALETLLFRARRSLTEELDNLVTCDRAALALSQQADRRLGRKERRRLVAHLEGCASCARVEALALKRPQAFKGLAALPLPVALTLFKGAPSASAAAGLPAIGATALGFGGGGVGAGGVAAGGVTAKLAVGLAAVTLAGGAGYEGVQALREPAAPAPPPKAAPAALVTAHSVAPVRRTQPHIADKRVESTAKVKVAKPRELDPVKPARVQARAKEAVRGRSAAAPGHTKPKPAGERGKSATAPGQLKKLERPKPKQR